MPIIKPISDLRNYVDVLKEVDASDRVYLTRNGRGAYVIMSVEEADRLDRINAMYQLIRDLNRTHEEADAKGWIEAEDLEKELGLRG